MDLVQNQSSLFQKIMNISELDDQMLLKQLDKFQDEWKVLIYDDYTYNFLSYYKTGHLRENNITLHININNQKEELLGVQVIYFISPSQESMTQLIKDLKNNYFEKVFICFSRFLMRETLETFCNEIISIGKTSVIKKIVQMNLDRFLIGKNSFTFLMEPKITQNSSKIAEKLLDLFLQQGQVSPVIYVKQDLYAEQIYENLQRLFQEKKFMGDLEQSKNKQIVFLYESQQKELSMRHSFTYLKLILDNFSILRNIKQFSNFQIEDQKIQLDFLNDEFLRDNVFEDYPVVGEKIYNNLQEWKKKYENLTQKKNDLAENFNEAIENLPQITEEKKQNYMHLKISSYLMKKIEERNLEKFSVIEQRVVDSKSVSNDDYQSIKGLLSGENLIEDKIRLYVIVILRGNLKNDQKSEIFKLIEKNVSEKEREFLERFNKQYEIKDSKTDLFSSIKNQSFNFVSSLVKSSYVYESTQFINELFKSNKINDVFEVRHLDQDYVFEKSQTEQIIVISLNGGDVLEWQELNMLGKSLNKSIIYGMDFLRKYEEILSIINQNKQWIKTKGVCISKQSHRCKAKEDGKNQNQIFQKIPYFLQLLRQEL